MPSRRSIPGRGPAAAAAALVLPGPDGLTREQLEGVYDAFQHQDPDGGTYGFDDSRAQTVDDDTDFGDGEGGQGPPCEQDLQWWAWCADHSAASGPCAADPAITAGARCHWNHQRVLAAARGRETLTRENAAHTRRLEHTAATSLFTGWLAAADEATQARVTTAVAERAAISVAQAHVDTLRTHEAALGAAAAAQVRALAGLAPLYAAALDPTLVTTLDAALNLERLDLLGAVDDLVAEIAPALSWSEGTATRRVLLAPRLVTLLPRTMARLEAGQVDLTRALIIAEGTERADPAVARRVDDLLCGPGGSGIGLNSAALRKEVDRVVATVDAAAVKERAKRKTAARGTTMKSLGDGISRLEVTGPTPVVAGLHRQLTAVAEVNRAQAQQAARDGRVAADGGDPYAVPGVDVVNPADAGDVDALLIDRRTLNAHRFDALMAAVGLARPADGSPRPKVSLEIQISLPGALGVSEDPGLVVGYGWIPAWLVRQGLSWGGCRVRRVLTDPYTGDLVTVDGHTYPASWLHDPDGPDPGGPGSPGSPGRPGPGSGGSPSEGGPTGGPGGPGPGSGGSPSEGGPTGGPGPGSPGGGGPGPGPGRPGSPGAGPRDGGGATPSRFKGLPVQRLPPPRTEDDVLGPPLTDEQLDDLAQRDDLAERDGLYDDDDPCVRGECTPVDPADCPLAVVGGGPHDPPAAVARHVRRAWGVCTGPGSTVVASRCDLDHVVAWCADGTGGPTCSCNLEPKSRSWHLIKHSTDRSTWRNPTDPADPADPAGPAGPGVVWSRRWRQWRCDHGSSHWVSPLGEAHHTRPRPVGEPAGPFRRVLAVVPEFIKDLPGRQHDDETTSHPFPDQPNF